MLALCYTVSLRMIAGADSLVDALGPLRRGDHLPPWSGEICRARWSWLRGAEMETDGKADPWHREQGTRNQELKILTAWNN